MNVQVGYQNKIRNKLSIISLRLKEIENLVRKNDYSLLKFKIISSITVSVSFIRIPKIGSIQM